MSQHRQIDKLGDAVQQNDERKVRKLVKKASRAVLDGLHSEIKANALMLAAGHNRISILRMLLCAKCSLEVQHPEKGGTALLLACQRGSEECTKILIEAKAELDARDAQGCTATYAATEMGELGRKLRFLRRIPFDPVTQSNNWGLRSYQDSPSSTNWGGGNVYDVYSRAPGLALDGTRYQEW